MKLKNFRRVAALGMAVGMTAVLAACGNTADTASSEAAESTAETADTADMVFMAMSQYNGTQF
jgi:basic membrane lipoprotein Med (substrate-binding protein (PBP1-ABC) superfamily)